MGEFETLDALADARARAISRRKRARRSDRQVRADVLKKLAGRVPFPVPGSLVDREVDRRVEDFARRLIDQRIDPRKANIDWASFRDAQREPANEAVASALVLDEIAQRDDIGVSEDGDRRRARESTAQRTGLTAPAVRARLEQEGGLERLVAGLRREKALSQVMDQAKIVDM